MNSENKSQLIAVMNEVWYADAFADKLQNRKIVSVVQGHFYLLESDDKRQTPELFCIMQMPKSMVMRLYYCNDSSLCNNKNASVGVCYVEFSVNHGSKEFL